MTDSLAGSRRGRWGLATAIAVVALLTFAAGANATIYRPTDTTMFQANLAAANANIGYDKIIIPDNTSFTPSAPLTITDRLMITGNHNYQLAGDMPALNGASVVPLDADFITVAAGVTVDFEGFSVNGSSGPSFSAIRNNGTLRMESMEIETNNGQGLANPSGSTAVVNNTLISDGGVLGISSRGSLTLTNSTITNNFGGGVDARGVFNLRNTVLQNPDSSNCFALPTAAGSGNNFSGDGFSGTDTSCGPTAATGDPQLDTFASNGGPTLSKTPLAGSPLINTGSAAFCPTTDQRFFVRPVGGCDIGAVEVGAARDTTPPSCTTAVRRGGTTSADEQDVTLLDGASGLGPDAVFSEEVLLQANTENSGTFSFTPKTSVFRSPAAAPAPSDSGLTVTAQKSGGGANNAEKMRWHLIGRDWAGNVRDYTTCP